MINFMNRKLKTNGKWITQIQWKCHEIKFSVKTESKILHNFVKY